MAVAGSSKASEVRREDGFLLVLLWCHSSRGTMRRGCAEGTAGVSSVTSTMVAGGRSLARVAGGRRTL